jgi:hypothetical protein|tara:strand:- start:5260 stop:7170 length:1911 start_codon:yes stop_codon:yes gene_type:complete
VAERINIELVVVDKTTAALKRTKAGVVNVNSSLMKTSALAKTAVAALGAFGAARIVKSVVNVGQQVEELGLRFKFLFGTAEEGAKAFDNLVNFAAKVPFTLEEIQQGAGNLAVISENADELSTNLELVGNVAAVTGLDFRTTSEQIQRAFAGGIASADIFRERGVRALLGFKEGAKVSVEETREAFQRVFGKGGQFGNATDEFANTLTGTISMLQDKLFKVQKAISDGFFEELKTQFGDLNDVLNENEQTIEQFSKTIGESLAEGIRKAVDAFAFLRENLAEVEAVLGLVFLASRKVVKGITGLVLIVDSVNRKIRELKERLGLLDTEFNKVDANAPMYDDFSHSVDNATESTKKNTEAVVESTAAYDDHNDAVAEANRKAHEQEERDKAAAKEKADLKKLLEANTKKLLAMNKAMSNDLLIGALEKVTDGADLLQGSIDAVAGGFETFRSTASTALTDVLMGTKSLSDALGSIVKETLRALIQGFINLGITIFVLEPLEDFLRKVFKRQRDINKELKTEIGLRAILALFGGGGGGGIPFLADGGPVSKNQPYIVGEEGPELFVPNKSGTIVPNNMMPQAGSSGGSAMGGDVTVNFNINTVDAAGMDELLVDRRTTIVGIINQALNQRGRVGVTNG